MFAALAAVALLATLSALHCAAMCGPLSSCASAGRPRSAVLYHVGRVVGYAALGAAAGGLGARAPLAAAPWLAAGAAWTAALVLLFAAARAWSMRRLKLVRIGRAKKAPPLRSRIIARMSSWIVARPAIAGALTSLLPCGVLWAAVVISLSSGSASSGALVMAVFALLTGVSVTIAALLVATLHRGLGARPLAIVFALSALAFIILPLPRLASSAAPAVNDGVACPLHPGGAK